MERSRPQRAVLEMFGYTLEGVRKLGEESGADHALAVRAGVSAEAVFPHWLTMPYGELPHTLRQRDGVEEARAAFRAAFAEGWARGARGGPPVGGNA
ncbi:hypothetical protein [Streptomyces albidoflavus]|uniref:hypothetical protein n=1 Tax=Streptomyces albidoflavus TaxID=1886 RepID=UPI003400C433